MNLVIGSHYSVIPYIKKLFCKIESHLFEKVHYLTFDCGVKALMLFCSRNVMPFQGVVLKRELL